MKHQIGTTIASSNMNFGGAWEQTMVCEFANDTIAELVWEDIRKRYRGHKECLLTDGSIKAELQREGETITAVCGKREYYTIHWDADPNTNQEALEALAQEWEQQEKEWLPIARYFEAGARDFNAKFQDWIMTRDEEVDALEHEIKNERLKREGDTKFREAQIKGVHDSHLERGRRLNDIEEALSLHRDLPFHFMDRKGGNK